MVDGFTVYQGKASDSVNYFKELGAPCPEFSNPADFYMKILSVHYPKKVSDERKLEILNNNYTKKLAPYIAKEGKEFDVPEI